METTDTIYCLICGKSVAFSFEKSKFSLYECKDCDFLFVWPPPKSLDLVYGADYFYKKNGTTGLGYTSYDEDKSAMKDIFIRELDFFERNIDDKSIFDVGSATGYFLDLAKKRNWQTAGSEVSEYGYKESKKRGHKMLYGDLLHYNIDTQYEVVTMWDVLEHVPNCDEYIQKVTTMLKENGFLVINTIDKSSWWARILGKKWNMIIPPEHLMYFSKKSLLKLLKKYNYEIIMVKKLSKRFSLSYIFKTLYEWQGIAFFETLTAYFDRPFWRAFSIPVNVRDNIYIVARKK